MSGPKRSAMRCGGDARVFDHVVQQRGAKRGDVQLHVRQDVRDFQGMRKVGIAGLAQLRAVLLGGKVERAPQQLNVARRARLPDLFNQFEEARLQSRASCARSWRRRQPGKPVPPAFRAKTFAFILCLFDAAEREKSSGGALG